MVNSFCLTKDFKSKATFDDNNIVVKIPYKTDEIFTYFTEDIVPNTVDSVRKFISDVLLKYDSSDNVNLIYIKHGDDTLPYWMDRNSRALLSSAVSKYKDSGNDNYQLDFREIGLSITVNCDTLLSALQKMEEYAVKCYNTTSNHLYDIQKLDSIDDILSYDITAGYPEKLTLEL